MKNINIFLIVMFSLLVSCSNKKEDLKAGKNEIAADSIKIIKLNRGRGIIFTASYAEKILTHPDKVKGVFTPDEKTIRYIDENLAANFDSIINSYQKENPNFAIFKKDLQLYDKQFLGCIDQKHDSIVFGWIFNLESDPYNIKHRLEKELMVCNDGWCDTNICCFIYNKRTDKFISEENNH